MKIVSWNINGLRAVANRKEGGNLRSLLQSLEADIICVQETKSTKEQLDSSLYLVDGYKAFFSFCRIKKGYSGVATFCRDSAIPVAAEEGLAGCLPSGSKGDVVGCYGEGVGLTQEELTSLDNEGRALLTEHRVTVKMGATKAKEGEELVEEERRLVVVNVYCPMYDPDRDKDGGAVSRLTVKTNFYKLLESRVTALERAGKLVVVVGDLNICRAVIDSAYAQDDPNHTKDKDPTSVKWTSRFIVSQPPAPCTPTSDPSTAAQPTDCTRSSPSEHSLPCSSSPLSTCLLDTFRYLHPTQENAYTCWSTLLDCRKTNFGTRIDYILASTCLSSHILQAEVWQHVEGSDHCPVFAEIDLGLKHSSTLTVPSLCSDFFSGRQSNLLSFVSSRPREKKELKDTTKTGGSPSKGIKRPLASSLPKAKQAKLGGQQTLFSVSSIQASKVSTVASDISDKAASVKQSGLDDTWKKIFKPTPKTTPSPLCKGHNEVCVLRKVKKSGPNKDREFWVCARPVGGKNDPQARCDHFQWASKLK